MRRNIAKVSALIMAATTTMSPMMPAATTVAWADEVATYAAVNSNVKNLVVDWDNADWTNETVTVKYQLVDNDGNLINKVYEVKASIVEYTPGLSCGAKNIAVAKVPESDAYVGGALYTHEVPEGTPHYAAKEHEYEEKSNTVNAVCGVPGSYTTWKECKNCGAKIDENSVEIPKLKHEYGEAKFDEKNIGNTEFFDNVEIKDGKVVVDATGTPKVVDPTKDAKYTTVATCKLCGHEETTTTTINKTKASGFRYILGENTEFDADGNVVLKDHTKAGTYTVQYVDEKGNDIAGLKEEKPIPAGHTWGDFTLQYAKDKDHPNGYDGYDQDTKDLFAEGKISYEIKDGEVVVKNSDCSRTATVRLVQTCAKVSDGNVINEKTVKTVTVAPTGKHQYVEKSAECVPSEDGKTHVDSRYKECVNCGDKVTLDDKVVSHYNEDGDIAVKPKTRTENIVEATCGKEGSYDVVTYCADCGYVFDELTKTYTVKATGDHKEWTAPELEWDGKYMIFKETGVNVTVHQYCEECGEERFPDKDGNAFLTVNAKAKDGVYSAETKNEDGKPVVLQVKVASKVEESKYECTPNTVKVEAVYSVDGKQVLKEEKVVPYFENKLDYYTQKDHVAGTPVTEKREDGTHNVTYCKYGCGTVMSDELVKPEEPEKTLGQVSGLKAEIKDGQVVVSWDKLEGADGYLVVAINGKVRGQQIGYTAGTSFVDKDANAKDYNYYWVIPYFKNADGKVVKGQLTGYKYAMKPTTFAANAKSTENGVELTWDAVEGASKYIVKAKAASEKVATELDKNVSGTSYVDATASADEYTFYWVFPVYTNAAGKEVVGNASTYAFGMTTK